MSSSDLKLYYFNLHARGEPIRLILAAAGRSYEDIRFDLNQWPEYKPKMMLGQCPVLEFGDGTQLPQSMAIARYIARETGLAGSDNLESAKIDAVVDTQEDINELFYSKVFHENDGTKKLEELQKFLNETLVKHVEHLGKLKKAYSQNDKYFVGNKLSWADLFVFHSIDSLFKAVPEAKGKYGELFKPLMDEIYANEKLKTYIDNRPKVPF
jgi:glutathione S-transferase